MVSSVYEAIFDVISGLGAALAMVGASTQLGLDIGERQGYMRRAATLDQNGAKAAKERILGLGYKNPEELSWTPRHTQLWLQQGGPRRLGWIAVASGAFLMFFSSLKPLASLDGWGMPALGFLALFLYGLNMVCLGIVTANKDEAGSLRAERDWSDANEGAELPADPERSIVTFFGKVHRYLFGVPAEEGSGTTPRG